MSKCSRIKVCASVDFYDGLCELKDHQCSDEELEDSPKVMNFMRLGRYTYFYHCGYRQRIFWIMMLTHMNKKVDCEATFFTRLFLLMYGVNLCFYPFLIEKIFILRFEYKNSTDTT